MGQWQDKMKRYEKKSVVRGAHKREREKEQI